MQDDETNQLARRARRGETDAFETLVRLLTPPLVSFFHRKGGCDAEELTQQTWTRVASGFTTYDPERDFKTWLFAIAYHLWVDRGRYEKLRAQLLVDDIPQSSLGDPITAAEFSEALKDCLEQLSEADRSAILRCYWKDEPLTQIAADREVEYGSLKAKVSRARVRLRECLRKKFPEA